jgi:hypothetical protein
MVKTDLDPVLSKDSINYHYEHLAKGYAKRYNAGEGNADFNRAGSFLHNKFFPQLKPPKGANRPRGAVLELIETNFKTYEDFKQAFKETAMKIQGSGWVYLSTLAPSRPYPTIKFVQIFVCWWTGGNMFGPQITNGTKNAILTTSGRSLTGTFATKDYDNSN